MTTIDIIRSNCSYRKHAKSIIACHMLILCSHRLNKEINKDIFKFYTKWLIFESHSLCLLLIKKHKSKLAKECSREQSNPSLFVNTNLVINHSVAADYCFAFKMLLNFEGPDLIQQRSGNGTHTVITHLAMGTFKDDANKI